MYFFPVLRPSCSALLPHYPSLYVLFKPQCFNLSLWVRYTFPVPVHLSGFSVFCILSIFALWVFLYIFFVLVSCILDSLALAFFLCSHWLRFWMCPSYWITVHAPVWTLSMILACPIFNLNFFPLFGLCLLFPHFPNPRHFLTKIELRRKNAYVHIYFCAK